MDPLKSYKISFGATEENILGILLLSLTHDHLFLCEEIAVFIFHETALDTINQNNFQLNFWVPKFVNFADSFFMSYVDLRQHKFSIEMNILSTLL